MTSKPRKPFNGTLAAPLRLDDPAVKMLHKLSDLFEHYEIPERNEDGSRNDLLLVLALANDFVPGFQPPRKETRGRSRTGIADKVLLLAKAGEMRENFPKSSVSAIAGRVAKNRGDNKRTIENSIYSYARDDEVRAFIQGLIQASQK